VSSLKTFTFRDANTLELRDDVVSSIVAYRDRVGMARMPPVEGVRNLGGGLYGVVLSDADVLAGTAFLVEPEPAVVPTHVSGSAYPPSDPIHAMHFENGDGTLWVGDPPSVLLYRSAAGGALTPPALVNLLPPNTHLYGIAPSASDLAAGASYLVAGAPGSIGLYDGSFLLGYVVGASLGASVFAVLTADPAVSSIIGVRAYPNVRPQVAALPLLVYNVVSQVSENALAESAQTRLKHARLQLDAYATTYKQAHELATAAENVLANLASPDLAGWKDNERDLYDDEARLHRVSCDYRLSSGA